VKLITVWQRTIYAARAGLHGSDGGVEGFEVYMSRKFISFISQA
jgi:hypothetical protein